MISRFGTSSEPANWGVVGWSAGGTCAIDLTVMPRTVMAKHGPYNGVAGYFDDSQEPAGHGSRSGCSTECNDFSYQSTIGKSHAKRAVELAPLEAETHAVMGQVAVEQGDKTTAEKALREALRLNPNLAMARNDLGRLHLLRKDHFGAAGHFAHAAADDVRMDVAQHNIDAALAMAVARVVFWVCIAVFVLGRFAVKEESDGSVGFGYALLAVLVALVIWQSVLIVPAARGGLGTYLRVLPHRDRLMTATVGLLMLGMIALMAM